MKTASSSILFVLLALSFATAVHAQEAVVLTPSPTDGNTWTLVVDDRDVEIEVEYYSDFEAPFVDGVELARTGDREWTLARAPEFDLELVVEYETALTLHDSADNADALREWNGYCADVTIAGRALRRDGAWNTLCLPFNMTAQQVAVQLTPAKLMTLSAASFVDGTLTLSFMDAAAIEAGRPYIIRWNAPAAGGGSDLINPTFTGVIVSNAVAPAEFACVDFVGNTSPAAFGIGDRTALFVGADGGLSWPAAAASLNAFRAYFRLKGMVAGLDVKRYVLNLGDETVTGAFPSAYDLWAAANGVAGAWNATDASGIHNVFRYVFNVPTGVFTNPPLLDIAIEGDSAVVITPPVSNTVGFAVSVVESSDVAGATVTRRKPLDATGRTVFPMGSAASRFYRLSATEGEASPGGVQLWENGPYWAECNVGASEPEEHGYYFWWGDTVGYLQSGGTWYSFGFYSSVTWVSSTGEQMSSSPFSPSSCPTYGKDDSELLSAGYVDSTGNLAPEYDAATAHLGAPWRMPTDAEFAALTNNCTATWTATNGVRGCLVTGKGAYADRSIFLPTAGYGSDSTLGSPNSQGYYWSSTPDPADSHYAWHLYFNSDNFRQYIFYGRQYGLSVRPVRDAD